MILEAYKGLLILLMNDQTVFPARKKLEEFADVQAVFFGFKDWHTAYMSLDGSIR